MGESVWVLDPPVPIQCPAIILGDTADGSTSWIPALFSSEWKINVSSFSYLSNSANESFLKDMPLEIPVSCTPYQNTCVRALTLLLCRTTEESCHTLLFDMRVPGLMWESYLWLLAAGCGLGQPNCYRHLGSGWELSASSVKRNKILRNKFFIWEFFHFTFLCFLYIPNKYFKAFLGPAQQLIG